MLFEKSRWLFVVTVLLSACILLVGCSSTGKWTFQEELPSMAHVHIGHAITGWKDAPGDDGLFNTAEKEVVIAIEQAQLAVEQPKDLAQIKKHIRGVIHAIDPEIVKKGPGLDYGVKKGLEKTAGHIIFAAKSDDASENVQDFAPSFESRIKPVIERCDLVVALCQVILATQTSEDAHVLAEETHKLTQGISEGMDVNNDGFINLDSGEIGLKQLRDDIEALIAREDPPYATVPKRYLFGVIRLPDGKWAFSWLVDPFYDDGDNSGGGGY
ncbi:MAG: hypothetical protein QNK40_14375 [Desulfobacterales bacterium]|nr:hypothetical protein [Desulfobacterales bacterium]